MKASYFIYRIFLFVVVLTASVCFNTFAQTTFTIDNIKYTTTSSSTVKVANSQDTSSISGALVIPSSVTYNNTSYSVDSIGRDAFSNCTHLTSITIPNGVTSIGEYAFKSCTQLASITIPNGVTSIGKLTFAGCSNLTNMNCEPTTPPTLGDTTFAGTPTDKTLIVPCESVKDYKADSLWNSAFNNINCKYTTLTADKWNFVGRLNNTIGDVFGSEVNNIVACKFNYGTNDWAQTSTNDPNDTTAYLWADSPMNDADGYMIYPFDNDVKVYPSFLSNDLDSVSVGNKSNSTTTGTEPHYYALGNPFSAPIDIYFLFHKDAGGKNNSILKGSQSTYAYTFNRKDNTWNASEDSQINPGEGFFVMGDDANPNLLSGGIYNPNRYTNLSITSSKSANSVMNSRITFYSTANGMTRTAYAKHNEQSSNGFDINDAYIMFSSNTKLVDPYFDIEGRQALSNDFKTLPYICPINFYTLSSSAAVDFSASNVPENISVSIINLSDSTETDLTEGQVFSFTAEEGNNAGKYAIKFAQKNSVGLEDVANNEVSMSLYPNPAKESTTLTINGLDKEATMTISDELGRVVELRTIAANQTNVTINTSEFASGVYYINVVNDKQTIIEKLIIK